VGALTDNLLWQNNSLACLGVTDESLSHEYGVLPYKTPSHAFLAFFFTYAKPCTILKFLSRAALQPNDFENPTMCAEVSDVEERR
jgi:hypothetical protein